jgi:methionyl aminopeptidase
MSESAAFRRKSAEELAVMAVAGSVLGACLDHVASLVQPGISTDELDRASEAFIRDHGCVPSFLGYRGFPKSICISVNDEAVHGIPGRRLLNDGDLVSLDCGVILDGWQSDSGMSVVCGQCDAHTDRLIATAIGALEAGIAEAVVGNHIGNISAAIGAVIHAAGFSPLDGHGGHGIGRHMHEPPFVANHGRPGTGNELRPGLVLAIEPIVNAGTARYRLLDDGWTVVTADGKRSSYAEHTVAIALDGPIVFSRRASERAAAGPTAQAPPMSGSGG